MPILRRGLPVQPTAAQVGRRPWRRLSRVVLSRIGRALWAGTARPKPSGSFFVPEYVIMSFIT
jgi:hypothetical protein